MPISGLPQPWTDAFLDGMRQQGDPRADDAIREVVESGSLGDVNRLLRTLIRNDQPPPAELPAVVSDYLDATAILPSWADRDKIRAGQDVFVRHGPLCLASLACASLPACYAQGAEARVLGTTQKLVQHEQRRILETGQFVIDVMQPGGLEPLGRGVRTAQKVRLMHAAIRRLLTTPPPPEAPSGEPSFEQVLLSAQWDAADGQPICQEDLAFTLQTFAAVILDSLERFGVNLTAVERESYVHAWAVAGSLIGLHDSLIPASVAEAQSLFEKIQRRQQADTADGRALMRSVERFVEGALRANGVGGGIVAPRLTRMLIRELLPPHTANLLGVAPLAWWEAITSYWIFRALDRVIDRADGLTDDDKLRRFIRGHLGMLIVRRLSRLPRGWQRQIFQIPDSLQDAWGMRRTG